MFRRKTCVEIDLSGLPTDPGLRPWISDYNVNIRDQVGKVYMQKGPCQPRDLNFHHKEFGEMQRRVALIGLLNIPLG